jgi:thiol-disulfide isomerase/thioredoxin
MAQYPQPNWHRPQPVGTDGKATTSLILGVLSILCFGIFTGLPAVVVGVMSRRDIARSGNAIGGGGVAIGGIITGAIGSVLSLVTFGFMLFGIFAARHAASSYTPPMATAYPPYTPPAITHGTTEIVDLHPASGLLQAQLVQAQASAKETGHTVLVEITARWCGPPCDAVKSELSYAKTMQAALDHVRIVRVDADEFSKELATLGMSTQQGLPVFYKIDATGTPTESLSADEWGDNTAENMAPVLAAFVAGTPRPKPHGGGADAGRRSARDRDYDADRIAPKPRPSTRHDAGITL